MMSDLVEKYKLFANTLRILSLEMVDKADSGHQGVCLGFADVMSVLWNTFYHPESDRFVLSNGHASAMLYATIYLSGNSCITVNDLKNFRKLGSLTQGHPERNTKLSIHITTGALGQGLASAVGLAIALKKKNFPNKVYATVGDGDLMEGISHEAMTLAASLNLNNLIVLFDDNNVCIDGYASDYTTDNIARVQAYGFNTSSVDGHDYIAIETALKSAQTSNKPVFIAFKTIIGKFTKQAGTNKCHGKYLKTEEIQELRNLFNLPKNNFEAPDSLPNKKYILPEVSCSTPDIKALVQKLKQQYIDNPASKSTRLLFGEIISIFQKQTDLIIGGSADLSESTCAINKSNIEITSENRHGNYIHYGIREHAMGAVMNGLAAEGFVPFGSTFLVFSDYMRPAIRNAALMKLGTLFVFTHDSIAVGEDGATHQPVEQLASLRSIPNLYVFRPACDIEVIECIELAIKNRTSPSVIVLSRQSVECCVINNYFLDNMSSYGMYEIFKNYDELNSNTTTLISTGSEVSIAIKMAKESPNSRVISAPCLELFEAQDTNYKKSILGDGPRIIIEAASSQSWYRYCRTDDRIISVDTFGESGKDSDLITKFLK